MQEYRIDAIASTSWGKIVFPGALTDVRAAVAQVEEIGPRLDSCPCIR